MSSPRSRRQHRREVDARAKRLDHMYSYCRVAGCAAPARAGTADGLDRRYCRSHSDHFQRHGSPTKASYRAALLNPYRRGALKWLVDHPNNPYVSLTTRKIEGLYRRAGPHIEAFRLQGKSPRERGWAAWARLRTHQIDPRLPIAAWLSVEMVVRDDPQPASGKEFMRVQAAKLVHRMASGSHRIWERSIPDPAWSGLKTKRVDEECHVYPKSRGRVLRHLGCDLEGAVELLVDHALADIRGAIVKAERAPAAPDSPYLSGLRGRRRKRSG